MRRLPFFKFLPVAAALLMGLSVQLPACAAPVKVFVSVPPQKYFVERVGGKRVKVSVLVPAGADPHTYEPKPATMVDLARSAAWFTIGVPFEESLLPRLVSANSNLAIVRTDEGVPRVVPPAGGNPAPKGTESGEPPVTHGHEGADPHIWLSPRLVKQQAENILRGLIRVDPAGEKVFRANARRFQAELDAMDRELKALFAGARGRSVLVFHPSWGYLASDYGFRQVAIEVEGKEPKGADLAAAVEMAREKRVREIFVEPQFSSRSARAIADSIGAKLVTADPLAANWADNLRKTARAFRGALR